MTDAVVRAARPADLEALTAIYNHYIVNTAITFDLEPFTLDQRREWLSHYAESGRHRLFVAACDGAVRGYACSSRFRPKGAYDPSVEVSIYLAPEYTNRGLGARLYTVLFDALRSEDVNRAYAGITLPNAASIALHRRFGFAEIGVYSEVGRKFGRYWNVQWFEKALGKT